MSCIHFKFKCDKKFDSVVFDGASCTLAELKKLVIQKKGLSKHALDFDLIINNAQTKQVYSNATDVIQRNSSVIVARIPATGMRCATDPSSEEDKSITLTKVLAESAPDELAQIVRNNDRHSPPKSVSVNSFWIKKGNDCISSNSCVPEADEIIAITNLQSKENGFSNGNRRSQLINGAVPHSSYICHRCNRTGHFKHACPLLLETDNSSSSSSYSSTSQQTIKRATGIPKSELIPLKIHVPGAYMTSEGTYAIPRKDAEAILNADSTVDWEKSNDINMESDDFNNDTEPSSQHEKSSCSHCNEKIGNTTTNSSCSENGSSFSNHGDFLHQQPITTVRSQSSYNEMYNSPLIIGNGCVADPSIGKSMVDQLGNTSLAAAAAAATLLLPSIVTFNELGSRLDPSKAEVALNFANTAGLLQAALVNASLGNIGSLTSSSIASDLTTGLNLTHHLDIVNNSNSYQKCFSLNNNNNQSLIPATLTRDQFDLIKNALKTMGLASLAQVSSPLSTSSSPSSVTNSLTCTNTTATITVATDSQDIVVAVDKDNSSNCTVLNSVSPKRTPSKRKSSADVVTPLKPRLVSHVHTVDKENKSSNDNHKTIDSSLSDDTVDKSTFLSCTSSTSSSTASLSSKCKKDKKKKNRNKSSKKHRREKKDRHKHRKHHGPVSDKHRRHHDDHRHHSSHYKHERRRDAISAATHDN